VDTGKLKTFAQEARLKLISLVRAKLEHISKLDPQGYPIKLKAKSEQVEKLLSDVRSKGFEAVVDEGAYVWFNRLTALRFMDGKGYNRVRALSPLPGHTQPELLEEFKKGNHDGLDIDASELFDILDGKVPSDNPQNEVYGRLLLAFCKSWHQAMPFLFGDEKDYTELLMPEDLLSDRSIVNDVNQAITDQACSDVEIVGWLYQYYISEWEKEIRASKKKFQPEEIPPTTAKFTPHWMVKYMVENSLGRLWLDNHPHSRLKETMEYYIDSERPQGYEPLQVSSPEEIRLIDPACGSGHILTYSFDLLAKIYEEEGYDKKDIPNHILTKNLYGLEIDRRASELASFALAMKAVDYYGRFFRRNPAVPNVCQIEKIVFQEGELEDYANTLGQDLVPRELIDCLSQFQKADSLGSLIKPTVPSFADLAQKLRALNMEDKLLVAETHDKVLKSLKAIEYLSASYHCVVANPPYMKSGNMNDDLKAFAKKQYPDSEKDAFAMFIERGFDFLKGGGFNAMVTMQSWMFLSSYESMREKLLRERSILSMAHIGSRGFDSIDGEVVQTTAFVLGKGYDEAYKGTFLRLVDGKNEGEKERQYLDYLRKGHNLHRANSSDFKKIPGSPIAYWASDKVRGIFEQNPPLSEVGNAKVGLQTGDNDRFLRLWHEVAINNVGFGFKDRETAKESGLKWFPINKGGAFRKWYGNNEYVVNWENDGSEMKAFSKSVIRNPSFYFQEGITWGKISSAKFSCRFSTKGFIFSDAGMKIFSNSSTTNLLIISLFNSVVPSRFLEILSETMNYEQGNISKVPMVESSNNDITTPLVNIEKLDWDSYETSWDFSSLPLLSQERASRISEAYDALRAGWRETTLEMQRLEEENNRIFIEAYGLEDELTPDVPMEEITLTCNPRYRYSPGKTDEEYESLLRSDTMKEFISYAVGCMFGRYSLDSEGLILANQGDGIKDYIEKVGRPKEELSFLPDEDNVLPIVDGEYFQDDIVWRFKRFLKVTFGEGNYQENLSYIEESIGKDLRSYFLKDFYDEHVRRYKKRPIYWLFSSPKKSFGALVYMHRYNQDTVNLVLNDYLRPYIAKLTARMENLERSTESESIKPSERTKALKEIETIKKTLKELKDYEREVYTVATQRLEIDLDDGVKVNYAKFAKILRKI